ncbi:ATP-dependent zinc metalloprotease FtsH [Herbinix luporum]|uniref:ATP-dependent zinc metalloprotease FtsH n=1 Tax=Herbinix luporum TaxID=1679721 RepID=A0A0K8J372_9FIRM|nr:ATP-dependent zinc metalloprotease FtsH [Herbinix luporum]MDI9489117.1 ATP-dependent zinc metalloprotease FtsH [Bacillota bacterium]CUH91935.1 ATP-dependent zinc metalloprotease FtsH [Herbinix luporum]HHT56239.1 ATP-dependent zinc metalloprotease FtsH [Herbinix luporum]
MENKNDNKQNKNGLPNKSFIIITLLSALFLWYMISFVQRQIEESTNIEKAYNEFIYMLENDQLKEVFFVDDKIKFVPKEQPNNYDITYYTGNLYDQELYDKLYEAYKRDGLEYNRKPVNNKTTIFETILSMLLPFILIYIVMWFLFKAISKNSGGVMGIGKSNAKVYVEKTTGVTFKDVAGQEEAKESLTEIVDFLHNPAKYTRIGAKLPKGALLVGPPGTGKTLLAKAVAGEAKVPFFSLSGSDFVEMFVGVGASRVRDLFKQAQDSAPCIIFIDEIDAIGKSRDGHYGNDEREQTLNQLLANMDGFDSSKGLVVLGATNRPEVLDKALLRPGRFDRRIIVDKPDLKGRIDILKVHAKNVLMHDSVDLEAIARATSGAVGSDLANMINEAAILAVKQGRTVVTQEDLFESVEVVIAGKEKKDRILSKEEKRIVAYHEVGHALVTALEKHSEPVQKITIVPRTMGSLGYVMQVPEEEKYLMSKDEMLTRIVTFFGGRAAEELVFGSVTTGASNDIEQATALARSMVTQYGMSDKFGLMGLESIENRYLDGRPVLNCSDQTAGEIDKEVMKILKECYDRAKMLLSQNREVLDKIAEYLIAKETITGEEFMNLYREVKGEDLIKADTDQKKDDVRDDVSKEEIPSKVNEAEDNTKEESVSETDKIDLNNNSVEKSISEADKDDTTVE